ncbi:methyl-accepting chemotaxis protein [Chitinibacter sp. SCUT-21]|uniref:methyl-accepting chemotaxis protein n=1 Tax=Chitinibacter sp. SCUT-21 TaxID=2970891 RepID=UPI0035A62064
MTLNRRLSLGIGVLVLVIIILAAVSYRAATATSADMKDLTEDHLPHLVKTQEIINDANTIARSLRNMQILGNSTPEDKAKSDEEWARVLATRANIGKTVEEIENQAKSINDAEALDYINKVKEKRSAFVAAQEKFKSLFDSGNVAESRSFVMGELRDSFNAYRDVILDFGKQEQEGALASAKDLEESAETLKNQIIVTSIIGLIIAIAIGTLLVRRLRRQLGADLEYVQVQVNKIADGDLSQDLNVAGVAESSLLAQIRTLQLKLRDSAKMAADNARVKTALDSVSTSVMISDADRNIIYCNRAVEKLLQNAEADIRKDLPQFNARNVIGVNIDSFHKNPSHQRSMLDRLNGEHRTSIVVGGRTFALIVNPVMNEKNGREGYVVEWLDRTEAIEAENRERKMAEENARILGALEATSTNVMLADENRNIVYMNKAVTAMLSRVEPELRKVLPNFNVSKLIGTNMDGFHRNPSHQSTLLANLTNTYRSQITVAGQTFLLIANPVFDHAGKRLGSVVEWVDRTAEVAIENEVSTLVEAAVNGDFSRRLSSAGKEGFMLKLAEGMNQMLSSSEAGMSDVARVLGALAQGDLTQKISADYRGLLGQLKDDCNMTCDRLAEIVTNIQEAASTINVASQEIAAGNSNLSSRTEQQAASLEETASSMEELTGTVKQNAENARQANQLAIGASDIAVKGGEVVGQVVSTMSDINDSAKKIVDIISVIDGIAFQTNILALNAAVEAARAGEQGRGFAVVASEVRNLAQRSAGAAKEIKNLIGDSVVKVEAGSKLVDQAGHTMQDVVSAVRRVTDIMSEISAASNEQSAGIEQVNQAITHMDENTQQNAALVEEAAAAAESLEDQANNLTQTVGIFKLLGGKMLNTQSSKRAPTAASVPSRVIAAAAKPVTAKAANRNVPNLGGADDDWEEF